MLKTKLMSMALSAGMIMTAAAPAFAAEDGTAMNGIVVGNNNIIGSNNVIVFTDVPETYWAKDQIDYFAEQGIVSGYEDGSFKPDKTVTREEFCKFLVTTFNEPIEIPESQAFSDVEEDRWSYPYIDMCKDFLTGYINPFGGLPAFHPAEDAAREDIAVALVRMLGYTDEDAEESRYALDKFSDGRDISPSLVGYVSIACELGLISGYPDGTFSPSKGITRAESIALLNRATKRAITNTSYDLDASADLSYSDDGRTVTIGVTAEKGTAAAVNGISIDMSAEDDMSFGEYVYEFDTEGTKNFNVVCSKNGKRRVFDLTAKCESGAPVIHITECPSFTTSRVVTISGTAQGGDDIALTVNGESVRVINGHWSIPFIMRTEGTYVFNISAVNAAGKTTDIERTVTFYAPLPYLEITECPEISYSSDATLRGTLFDLNFGVSLTINGESVYVSGNKWTKSISLSEGVNHLKIVATNACGKSVTEERSVEYIRTQDTYQANQNSYQPAYYTANTYYYTYIPGGSIYFYNSTNTEKNPNPKDRPYYKYYLENNDDGENEDAEDNPYYKQYLNSQNNRENKETDTEVSVASEPETKPSVSESETNTDAAPDTANQAQESAAAEASSAGIISENDFRENAGIASEKNVTPDIGSEVMITAPSADTTIKSPESSSEIQLPAPEIQLPAPETKTPAPEIQLPAPETTPSVSMPVEPALPPVFDNLGSFTNAPGTENDITDTDNS